LFLGVLQKLIHIIKEKIEEIYEETNI